MGLAAGEVGGLWGPRCKGCSEQPGVRPGVLSLSQDNMGQYSCRQACPVHPAPWLLVPRVLPHEHCTLNCFPRLCFPDRLQPMCSGGEVLWSVVP